MNEQMKAGEGEPERVTFSNLFIIAPPAAENEEPEKGRQEQ